jgi:hypothetical protein
MYIRLALPNCSMSTRTLSFDIVIHITGSLLSMVAREICPMMLAKGMTEGGVVSSPGLRYVFNSQVSTSSSGLGIICERENLSV